jgi:uncharacterized membrane protein YdcZ (DUF606 family)
MKSVFLVLGVSTVIFGVIISYLLVSSVMKFGQAIEEIQAQSFRLTDIQRNQIMGSSLIGAAIVLIGVILTREGFKT